jgi:hypothetical protein
MGGRVEQKVTKITKGLRQGGRVEPAFAYQLRLGAQKVAEKAEK